MFISVRNIPLAQQEFPTSCWISAAHFLLQYVGVNVTLRVLHARYYNPALNNVMAMNGAGNPVSILGEYAFDAGYAPKSMVHSQANEVELLQAVANCIRDNLPVIAVVRSPQVQGFAHALVITAIDSDTYSVAFKDPGTGFSLRPFGNDVRMCQRNEFFAGFSYRYARAMQMNVWAYCTRVIMLRPLNEMSLFD